MCYFNKKLCRCRWTSRCILSHNRFMPSWILSGTTRVSRHQKGKTMKLKPIWITGARDNEWQWHQLGHMQICTLTQTHNHASNPLLSYLQARCPSCRPTNSVKALKAPEVSCKPLQYPKLQCVYIQIGKCT